LASLMESSIAESPAQCSMARKDDTHFPSGWQVRKLHARVVRNAQNEKCKQLEELVSSQQARILQLEQQLAKSYHNASVLNLERYSEDFNIIKHVVGSSESRPIAQHTGHQPLVSTTELARTAKVENAVVPDGPKDKFNALQCQVCGSKFATRNLLFQHLEQEFLSGRLERTGSDDKAHRRRWRARQRNRRLGSRSSRGGCELR